MIKINTLKTLENISDCYYINNKLDIINKKTNYVKTQTLGKRGYYYVTLNDKDNKQRKVPIHKIVALAFIENRIYEVINHKDLNKLNNSIDNLEFITQKENVDHAFNNGRSNRIDSVFTLEYMNGDTISGTIKELMRLTNIPKGTLYDMMYKNKGSKKHLVKKIID